MPLYCPVSFENEFSFGDLCGRERKRGYLASTLTVTITVTITGYSQQGAVRLQQRRKYNIRALPVQRGHLHSAHCCMI